MGHHVPSAVGYHDCIAGFQAARFEAIDHCPASALDDCVEDPEFEGSASKRPGSGQLGGAEHGRAHTNGVKSVIQRVHETMREEYASITYSSVQNCFLP